MPDEDRDMIHIKLNRRKWYEWVAWGLWLFLELMFAQGAIASHQELEPRAAFLFWLIFGVLWLGGVITWFIQRFRLL